MQIVSPKGYRSPKMRGFEGRQRIYPVVGIPFSASLGQFLDLDYQTKGRLHEWGDNDIQEGPDGIIRNFNDKFYYVCQYVVKPWYMESFKEYVQSIGGVFIKITPKEIAENSI